MKFVIAVLLGAITAVKLDKSESPDCPDSHKVFSYNERVGSAAGLLQTSSCLNAGVEGISCMPPNTQLWAEGMKGDEDLGQDI